MSQLPYFCDYRTRNQVMLVRLSINIKLKTKLREILLSTLFYFYCWFADIPFKYWTPRKGHNYVIHKQHQTILVDWHLIPRVQQHLFGMWKVWRIWLMGEIRAKGAKSPPCCCRNYPSWGCNEANYWRYMGESLCNALVESLCHKVTEQHLWRRRNKTNKR